MSIIDLNFPLDYILITIILLIVIISTWKGLIKSILALLTWIGSILITLYTYNTFASYLNNQLIKIDFFTNYEYLTNIISIIISIPVIFLVSLFIFKRVRFIITSDIDKQTLGTILDKLFGIIYGIFFSYFLISTAIYILIIFELNDLNGWLINNSQILNMIHEINNTYFLQFMNNENLNNI